MHESITYGNNTERSLLCTVYSSLFLDSHHSSVCVCAQLKLSMKTRCKHKVFYIDETSFRSREKYNQSIKQSLSPDNEEHIVNV